MNSGYEPSRLSSAQPAQLEATDDQEPDVVDIPEAPAGNRRLMRRGLPAAGAAIRLTLDADVLAWLQDRGAADQAHINDMLRVQMQADLARRQGHDGT